MRLKKIKVLIVDDSVVFRSAIRSALEKVDWIEIVGAAANGRIALDKMQASSPDLVTLDLEMPELDGLNTLQEMQRRGLQTNVIVFAGASKRSAQATMEALNLGAKDFVLKPGPDESRTLTQNGVAVDAVDSLGAVLVPRIQALIHPTEGHLHRTFPATPSPSPSPSTQIDLKNLKPEAVLIGSSTGGPNALERIFSDLRGPFRCPVFIVQHMPPVFTASLATRLSKLCGVPAAEGQHNEVAVQNKIYIAPGNFHMCLERRAGLVTISLNQQEQEHSVRPAVDQLFRTASAVFHKTCLGIILTGMGKDGAFGCQALRQEGNPVIIQNKESCVVFGMPGAVYDLGAYDAIQDLDQIKVTLKSLLFDSKGAIQ